MQERVLRRGRPSGSKTADPVVAAAFGSVIRSARTSRGIAQEALALRSGIERSHMGRIERGEHMPTLSVVFKLSKGLGMSASVLIQETAELLPADYMSKD
jgi:transcriptional regulator with XRE-family HTH domain